MVSLVRVENILERFLPEDISCCVVEVPHTIKGAKLVATVTQQLDERKTLKKMSKHLPNIALPSQFVVYRRTLENGKWKDRFSEDCRDGTGYSP